MLLLMSLLGAALDPLVALPTLAVAILSRPWWPVAGVAVALAALSAALQVQAGGSPVASAIFTFLGSALIGGIVWPLLRAGRKGPKGSAAPEDGV